MTSVTLSNQGSAVVQTLLKYSDEENFVYNFEYGLPNFSREWVSTTKTGAYTGNTQSVVFDVIKGGLLKSMYVHIQMVLSSGANIKSCDDFGLNLFNSIVLSNNNRQICQLLPQGIRAWINRQPLSKQLGYNQGVIAPAGLSLAGSMTVNVYVPLPFSFTKQLSTYLDTNYLDSMTLTFNFNALSTVYYNDSGTPTAPTVGTSNITLYSEYLTLDNEAYAKYRAMQFPAEKPTVMLMDSYEYENDTKCAGNDEVFPLTSKRVITETYFKIVSNTATTADNHLPISIAQSEAAQSMIKLKLRGNGKVLYEVKCYPYQLFESDCVKRESWIINTAANTSTTYGMICINWRLLEAQLKDCWEGGLSLKNISGAQLEIEAGTSKFTSSFTMKCVHKYMELVEVEQNSGRLSVATAN